LAAFSVLYGPWATSYVAFNGDVMRELAARFMTRAEKQRETVPLMIGHRMVGLSLLSTGEIAQSRAHLDRSIALYDPSAHPSIATRFGHDNRVASLIYRSWALWMLGYPEAALADAERAIKYARELGQAATLMLALCFTSLTYSFCGNYSAANARLDEDRALANEKGAALWKAFGMLSQGCVLALTGKSSDAAQTITAGLAEFRATGSTFWTPLFLSYLAKAYAELRQVDDAWRSIDEVIIAVQATKEALCEAEVHRVAGEIALLSPERDVAKAEAYFQRALAIARQQQAKSWELRAATSLARLWRDQGKVQQARELLGPIYGWFTEGFDTRDLKEAGTFLDALVA
jgi:predicted ATPase